MIHVNRLEKSFKAVHAMRGVSFAAADGAITSLIGQTTTLRILYTVLKPDCGSAAVVGFDTGTARRDVQRLIGVLADSRGLYPRLTSREHIRYFGRLHGMKGAALESRIDELVKLLDMVDIVERRAQGFSKGQTMKVALARALVHRPHNVVLDEPTNGLDVASARTTRDPIRRIRDEGRCVLFSSHIMSEVEKLCDKLAVVGDGRVIADGTPDELRRATGQTNLEEVFLHATATGNGGPGKITET